MTEAQPDSVDGRERMRCRGGKLGVKFVALTLILTSIVMVVVAASVIRVEMDSLLVEAGRRDLALHREGETKSALLLANLRSKGENLAAFVATLCPAALRNGDTGRLQDYVSQACVDPDVVFAAVYDADGNQLTEGRVAGEEGYVLEFDHDFADDTGERGGMVRVWVSQKNLLSAMNETKLAIAGLNTESDRLTWETLKKTVVRVLVSFAAGVVALACVLFLAVDWLVIKPLRAVSETLSCIARGEFDKRVLSVGNDEVGELAASVNGMAGRLETTTVSRDALTREVEERRAAQEALAQSNERFRGLVEGSPFGIMMVGENRRILDVNPAALEVLGRTRGDVIGQVCHGLVCPSRESECPVFNNGSQLDRQECMALHADGRPIPILKSAKRSKYQGQPCVIETFVDISDRKRQQEERERLLHRMEEAQKLESLGAMAGGIAHDFNNLLMAMLGNAELALGVAPHDPSLRESIAEIRDAGKRAADLCRQMLAYSGHGMYEMRPVELSRLVTSMENMLVSSIAGETEVAFDLADGLRPVHADATQLRQVILSLVANASEASVNGATVYVRAGEMTCDDDYFAECAGHESHEPGLYAFVEVADTGCGMSPETLGRMFDPFFTTKFTGRGLGLAAVQGIIRGHGGAIRVTSEEGQGTTVRILFPVVEASVAQSAQVITESSIEWQGSGTVLLVDDEHHIRTIASQMLEHCGFDVVIARDGVEAVRMFGEHSEHICCVLMDLTMPRMDGETALGELRKIREDIPVIIATGFDATHVGRRLGTGGPDAMIQKPYQLVELRQTLRDVLLA